MASTNSTMPQRVPRFCGSDSEGCGCGVTCGVAARCGALARRCTVGGLCSVTFGVDARLSEPAVGGAWYEFGGIDPVPGGAAYGLFVGGIDPVPGGDANS